MNYFKHLIVGSLVSTPLFLSAETKMIEKVESKEGSLVIPYEKYILDNGLTLIIHEDHSDPVVHVDVTYHVGSAREEIGKSGFAHFFEHMMFQGSENVGDEDHFAYVTEAGGTLNGTTNRDRTNYFETLPSNQLELGLWLEADRMGFLLNAVTQEKFEIQRATVKNERGQNYDNRPYGLAGEYTSKNLYPYGHPYSWLTIGYIEDLNRVDVNDLKRFFMRWYGPNNATLTVGGDINPQDVVGLVEKYFGSIPRGPEVKNMQKMMPKVDSDRYISYQDQVRFPMLQMTWPSVPLYSKEEAALDCMANIIGGGQTSILYKNLVKNQKAIQAVSYQPCFELSGEFTIQVLATPGSSLKEIQSIVDQSLEEFEKRGVTEEDVKKYAAQTESSKIYGLATVAGKVSQLAQYATFTETPNYLQKDLERYQKLTPKDVVNAYNTYIKGKAKVILSVYPQEGENLVASTDNFTVDQSKYTAAPDEYSGLTYSRANDDFDRSKKPVGSENPIVKVPEIWDVTLSNEIKVLGTFSDEIPVVSIVVSIEGGQRLEEYDLEKAGITTMLANLMNESTAKKSAEDMANALELLGSSVNVNASANSINVNIQTLKKNLDATLALAEEIMFSPGFKYEDFNRLKKRQIELIQDDNTKATSVANKIYNKVIYGQGNVQGIPENGTVETVNNIELEDVITFYKRYFSPRASNIVIVGDISQDEIMPNLKMFEKWNGEQVIIPQIAEIPESSKTTIYLVDKEKSAQSQIRIGKYTGLKYDATGDYYLSTLANYPLGGSFNSRINLNLREDKGYTYGARSYFNGDKYDGTFTASAGVKLDASAASVKEFISEISKYYKTGITEEELSFLKNSIGQREALSYESPFQKAAFLKKIIYFDLERNFTEKQNEILQNVTKDQLDKLSRKYMDPSSMAIIIVGDKSAIYKELVELKYPIKELDVEGNEVIAPQNQELEKKK